MTVLDDRMIDALDEKTARAINGDEGGLWGPAEPVWLGGAGVRAEHALASREVRVARGGRLALERAWPELEGAVTRRVLVPLARVSSTADADIVPNRTFAAVASHNSVAFALPIRRWLNDREEILRARLWVRALAPIDPRSDVPLPQFGVVRQNGAGTLFGDQSTLQSFAATFGIALTPPYPTTVDAYWNGGKSYALTWKPTQNAVVDLNAYDYSLFALSRGIAYSTSGATVYHSLELTLRAVELR